MSEWGLGWLDFSKEGSLEDWKGADQKLPHLNSGHFGHFAESRLSKEMTFLLYKITLAAYTMEHGLERYKIRGRKSN